MNETRRVAIVTGANRGIGLATCRKLAQAGFKVVATARNPSKGEAAAERLQGEGLDVLFHPVDVSKEDSVAALGAFVRARCGRADVLINNAGVLLEGHGPTDPGAAGFFQTSLETLRQNAEVHLFGPLLMAQEIVPIMRLNHYGRIVNLSSGMGQLTDMGPGFVAYRSTKAALNALTRVLALEVHKDGILVNAVCPGWVRTDMGTRQASRSPEEAVAGILWAATLEDDGPTGGFFRDGQPLDW